MVAFFLFLVVLVGLGAWQGWRVAAVIGAVIAVLALLVIGLGGCGGAAEHSESAEPPFGWCCDGFCGLSANESNYFEQCACDGYETGGDGVGRGECVEPLTD